MQITENLEIGKCVRICTKFNFEFVPIFSLKMSVFFDTAILFDNAIYTQRIQFWAAKNDGNGIACVNEPQICKRQKITYFNYIILIALQVTALQLTACVNT